MSEKKRNYIKSYGINVFKKADEIKMITKRFLGEKLTPEEILSHLTRIKNYHYSKDRKILDEEIPLYKYLLTNGYNLMTIIFWVKSTMLPEDIRNKISKGLLTPLQAVHVKTNLDKRKKANLGLEIIEDGKFVVNNLHTYLMKLRREYYDK